ncbi:TetR/AcrR family transcriptional regulator [Paenibacillus solisilvae]|uniref:TetR/AcrR family transcriptional regulator n=1 Tax=Paenibacillus solisilvae TaxID=2486751 RepID=A0ABW0VW31_9BACL
MSADIQSFKTYPNARQSQQEQLRKNIVNAACSVLIEEGIEALTVRNIAHKLECSTKIVYSLFGSKEKLVNEMFVEGCRILTETISRIVPGDDPKEYLLGIGEAYWGFSNDNSSYFRFMFGGGLQGFKPDENSIKETAFALSQVTEALRRYSAEGKVEAIDPLITAQMLWSSLHGVLHLAISGHFTDETRVKKLYDNNLKHMIQSLLLR